jgi:RNA polymerase sigma factor (sigma-70 family)
LDHSDLETDLKDDDFARDLTVACKRIFPLYKQSTYDTWEDLRQGVLIKYGLWLPRYRREANHRTVFDNIARNLLIDAIRKEMADFRRHDKLDLDQQSWDALPGRGSTDDKILLAECRRSLSKADRQLFDQHFVNGESLRSIAAGRNVSTNAVSKKWIRIANSLRRLLTS